MASRKRANTIVRGYLERLSWRTLKKHPAIVKGLIRGQAGVYALYKGEKLYYIGLASNLRSRVNHHLKDRHFGHWDRFSVYLTIQDEHIRPLEALILRVVNPSGNRVKGRLTGAQDLAGTLKRMIDDRHKDETAADLGERFVRHRRRAKMRSTKGTRVLAGLVERRMQLFAKHKKTEYKATLRRDGQISYKGKLYSSPTPLAHSILGRGGVSGWHFWKYRKNGELVRLSELKR